MNSIGKSIWDFLEHVLRFMVYSVLKLKLSENSWNVFMQFVRFAIVGISNTLVGYLIYAVSLIILRQSNIFPETDIYIAQFIMFLLSVLWSFYWNNKAVFKRDEGERRNIAIALIKTYISYAFTCLFLSEALLFLWVKTLGISEYIAPMINLIITVPLNFFIQKFWAFRKKRN